MNCCQEWDDATNRFGHAEVMRFRERWNERVVPRLVDVALDKRISAGWRDLATADLGGKVLELGFGSGLNLDHYGPKVRSVLAVEPSELAWSRAREPIARFGRPVERIGVDGARVALPDISVDAVVSTWTMCTIPDLTAALAEVRRVLRPEGTFSFVEHSLAPTPRVATVQHRLQPWWGSLAGGCHLDRDIPAHVLAAGFEVPDLMQRYAASSVLARPFGWFVSGRAVPVSGRTDET